MHVVFQERKQFPFSEMMRKEMHYFQITRYNRIHKANYVVVEMLNIGLIYQICIVFCLRVALGNCRKATFVWKEKYYKLSIWQDQFILNVQFFKRIMKDYLNILPFNRSVRILIAKFRKFNRNLKVNAMNRQCTLFKVLNCQTFW